MLGVEGAVNVLQSLGFSMRVEVLDFRPLFSNGVDGFDSLFARDCDSIFLGFV